MKKTNKNLVLELLEKDYLCNGQGLTTAEISQKLSIQRTNVSKILNDLVNEGFAMKSEKARPVLYSRTQLGFERNEKTIFEELIGWDSSLKHAIHLAKAAIMYPNKSLNTLIIGPSGSGKSFLAKKMYEYAMNSEVLEKNAPFVKLNCIHYVNQSKKLNEKFLSCLNLAEKGFFYVDNCNLLDSDSKNLLSSLLNDGYIEIDSIASRILCKLFILSRSN